MTHFFGFVMQVINIIPVYLYQKVTTNLNINK